METPPSNPKPKREKIPQPDVLAWLQANWPELHAVAEPVRDWIWIPGDFRGDHNQAMRDSIKEYGFRFAKRGHVLPSGKQAFWAHSCDRPTRFKRRDKDGNAPASSDSTSAPASYAPANQPLDLDEIAAAFA